MQDHQAPPYQSPRRTLTVRGRGTASAKPDLVVLAFQIVGQDHSYATAVETLNERVEALRSELESVGVERTDLKTTRFDVGAENRYNRKKEEHVFLGYRASHELRLELAFEKDLLDRVLGSVARSASEAAVRISFDVSDRKAPRRRAMKAAVKDARETARVLAESAGASLGEIEQIDYSFVEIRTRSFSYTLAEHDASRLASPAPEVEPEAMEAEEGVTVVWSIS